MNYYAAVVNKDEIDACCLMPPYNILASFHYFKEKQELIKECVEKRYSVLIDSGAFSAENSNKSINIDEYCSFLLETGVTLYAGLDVIGNAKATRENNEYMVKEYALKPIPTFHMGSKIGDLDKLLEAEYPYIALGGMVFGAGIDKHCDAVWGHILRYAPKLQVHGFGLTNVDLMRRYPWYSVDSSSFKSCKRFGRQNLLWNGFNFRTFSEEEFLGMLAQMGHNIETLTNRQKWFLYDFFGSQAYKVYGCHLKEINKIKDFSYLTAQSTLF